MAVPWHGGATAVPWWLNIDEMSNSCQADCRAQTSGHFRSKLLGSVESLPDIRPNVVEVGPKSANLSAGLGLKSLSAKLSPQST